MYITINIIIIFDGAQFFANVVAFCVVLDVVQLLANTKSSIVKIIPSVIYTVCSSATHEANFSVAETLSG